jgi:Leucine-rich repeat (LRR) protein
MRNFLKRITRFRLATLLVAITVVALWLGWQTYLANQQRAAVAAIEAVEGIVKFGPEGPQGVPRPPGEGPSLTDRIKAAIGRDYFESVTIVDLATNNGLLRGTRQLKATTEVIAKLASLPKIEILELGHCKVVDDSQLIHFSGLRNLNTIYLHRTAVRGPGLARLANLPALTAISLDDTPLQDEGLVWLAKMPQLKLLTLKRTRITDVGVAQLVAATNLETLSLSYTDVTDEGLKSLEKLPTLKELNLSGTKVTAGGVARLRQSLPNCSVSTSFGLGLSPIDVEWFPFDREPTVTELNARLQELGIDGQASSKPGMPGGAITELWLGSITLSDRCVLDLVQRLPHLERLNIRGGLVGDELVQGLAGRDKLTFLSLSRTRVTNDGLAHLAKLPNLKVLYLMNTQITDQGLPHLYFMKPLKELALDSIRISDDAYQQLKRELPQTLITR